MLNKRNAERRDFLRMLARSGMLLPFASSLLPGGSLLAKGGKVRRLITVYYPNGAILDSWHPKSSGRLNASSLNYALEPLEPYANRMIAFRNLSTKGHGGSSSHPEAASSILSGGERGAQSFDVAIGNHLSRGDGMPYLHCGLFTRYNRGKDYLLFRDPNGQSILPEDDPQKLARQIFGASDDGEDQKAKLEVLELIADDLKSLKAIVPEGTARTKLRVHEQSFAYLESLISHNLNLSPSCGPERAPAMGADRRENNERAEKLVLAQFDNIVGAFKCNLTSVASFQFMAAQDESLYINFESIQDKLDRADSGGFGSSKKWWNQNTSHSSSHEGNEIFAIQNYWYNLMIAQLCRKLDEVEDPLGGGTLLDTSTILVCSENGESSYHGMEDVAWYLVGGANGAFHTGRVIDLRGRGSSDLLWELGMSMGMAWSRFGGSSMGVPELYRTAARL